MKLRAGKNFLRFLTISNFPTIWEQNKYLEEGGPEAQVRGLFCEG